MSAPRRCLAVLAASLVIGGCHNAHRDAFENGKLVVHLGYMPNVTHAQALIGVSRGDFARAMGPDVKLETSVYNAGPSIIEAIYAGHLDLAYVGPSPALNGYLNSHGEEVRVVAGSGLNGVLVVGNPKRGITTFEKLKGSQIATPQMGNTQDISAKYFLTTKLGAKLKTSGGETDVMPIANADTENLFRKNQLDAAWLPEPWGSRLVKNGLAVVIIPEKKLWPKGKFALASVIVRRWFLEQHPDIVGKFLEAHARITKELQADAPGFAEAVDDELKRLTSKRLDIDVVRNALGNTGFSTDLEKSSYEQFYKMGRQLGFIRGKEMSLDRLFAPGILEKAKARIAGADAAAPGISSQQNVNDMTTGTRMAPERKGE